MLFNGVECQMLVVPESPAPGKLVQTPGVPGRQAYMSVPRSGETSPPRVPSPSLLALQVPSTACSELALPQPFSKSRMFSTLTESFACGTDAESLLATQTFWTKLCPGLKCPKLSGVAADPFWLFRLSFRIPAWTELSAIVPKSLKAAKVEPPAARARQATPARLPLTSLLFMLIPFDETGGLCRTWCGRGPPRH